MADVVVRLAREAIARLAAGSAVHDPAEREPRPGRED
jgi:hypothetical protein